MLSEHWVLVLLALGAVLTAYNMHEAHRRIEKLEKLLENQETAE